MSTATRIISGSAASWARMAVNVVVQMALVPIYLTHWEVETYGIWLAIQALISILSTLDKGYQNFIGFEFLKFGKENTDAIGIYLSSGSFVGVLLGLIQILLIIVLTLSGSLNIVLGEIQTSNPDIIQAAGIVLFFQSIAWLISGSIGGIIGRALSVYGYYPRMTWWGVFASIITSVSPIIAVLLGYSLLGTGIVSACATIAYNIPLYIDMFRLLKREKVRFVNPSLGISRDTFISSLLLSAKDLLENFRQQGIRLFLTPIIGATGLAAFSTMRTGSNIALQGLGTITNPLMPELMRFIHKRDQEKMEASFATVWTVVIFILVPGVIILQAMAPFLFQIWVKGQIQFDPLLFAALSLSVLVYAQSQPAMSVIRGNNLLRPQLVISLIAVCSLMVSLAVLVPILKLAGAGYSILISELIATQGYKIIAKKWLVQNGLRWPKKSSQITGIAIGIAAISMSGLALSKDNLWHILLIAAILVILNSLYFWRNLPDIALIKFKGFFKKPVYQ